MPELYLALYYSGGLFWEVVASSAATHNGQLWPARRFLLCGASGMNILVMGIPEPGGAAADPRVVVAASGGSLLQVAHIGFPAGNG